MDLFDVVSEFLCLNIVEYCAQCRSQAHKLFFLPVNTVRQLSFGLHRNTCGTSCAIILVQDFVRIPAIALILITQSQNKNYRHNSISNSVLLVFFLSTIMNDTLDCSVKIVDIQKYFHRCS